MSRLARWEWVALAAIVAVGAWLRFSHLALIEFKSDEAIAVNLALQFVQHGQLPTAGLMSSVGVTNPPLFIYLLIPMFYVTKSVAVVSCFIAVFGLAAVVACWWIGRKFYGPLAGAVAAGMFAASPWAVIFSRKIWAQDFVPVFVTGMIWAVHELVVSRKSKAIFWVVMLPLCVIQIHFSGFALTAAAVAIVVVLRPKIDWRFAAAGLLAAGVLLFPYMQFQAATGWRDFKQAASQVGGQKWNIPPGITIRPDSGYPLPRRPSESWIHALAIMNGGEIEDVLGLSTGRRFDPQQIWSGKGFAYFYSPVEVLMTLQRIAFVIALAWLAIRAVKSVRVTKVFPFFEAGNDLQAWILVLWVIVPLGLFIVAGLWTYLSYYVILYPAHFLALGTLAERSAVAKWRGAVAVVAIVLAAGSAAYMCDVYRFVGKYGGSQGTYGSGLGFKEQTVDYLMKYAAPDDLLKKGRFVQMDRLGEAGPAQYEFAVLANLKAAGNSTAGSSNLFVLLADVNRTNYRPMPLQQLSAMTRMSAVDSAEFGPVWVYIFEKIGTE